MNTEIRVVRMTPQLAEDRLTLRHPQQRKIMNHWVERLASDMTAGRWRSTGVPFCTLLRENNKLVLIDGQHRCLALSRAGVVLEVHEAIVTDPMAMTALDCGSRRRAGQILAMRGNDTFRPSVTRAIAYEACDLNADMARHMTTPRIVELCESLPPDLAEQIFAWQHLRAQKCAVAAPMLAVAIRAWKHDPSGATQFFTAVFRGESVIDGTFCSAADLLVKWRLASKSPGGYQWSVECIARTAKAWLAYRDGRELRILKFVPAETKSLVERMSHRGRAAGGQS